MPISGPSDGFAEEPARARGHAAQEARFPNRRLLWETQLSQDGEPAGRSPYPLPGLSPDDYDTPFCGGRTPLIEAILRRDRQDVLRLIEAGANLDLHDLQGRTPLIHAIIQDCEDIVACLLEHHCNPDKADPSRSTPLMYACYFGQLNAIRELLERDADTSIRDMDGRDVFAYAIARMRGKNTSTVLRFLRTHLHGQRSRTANPDRQPWSLPEYERFKVISRVCGRGIGRSLLSFANVVAQPIGVFFIFYILIQENMFGSDHHLYAGSLIALIIGMVLSLRPMLKTYRELSAIDQIRGGTRWAMKDLVTKNIAPDDRDLRSISSLLNMAVATTIM